MAFWHKMNMGRSKMNEIKKVTFSKGNKIYIFK